MWIKVLKANIIKQKKKFKIVRIKFKNSKLKEQRKGEKLLCKLLKSNKKFMLKEKKKD